MSEAGERQAGVPGSAGPLYLGLKQEIRRHVESGDWPPGSRVPSENQIVEAYGVSRMTANRALRELAQEGLVRRVQGVGSFVAEPKGASALVEIRNIADEICGRGHVHEADLIVLRSESAPPGVCAGLGLPEGATIFHSVIVHRENRQPVQVEDRFVNPHAAPDYLAQDFAATTPNAYLSAIAPIAGAEQIVEAVRPAEWEARLLAIEADEPCLLVRRRTWSAGRTVTTARLVYPGSRYRLEGAFGP